MRCFGPTAISNWITPLHDFRDAGEGASIENAKPAEGIDLLIAGMRKDGRHLKLKDTVELRAERRPDRMGEGYHGSRMTQQIKREPDGLGLVVLRLSILW